MSPAEAGRAYTLGSVVGAAIFYGAWAAWMNSAAGAGAATRAALVQATSSAIMTMLVLIVLTALYNALPKGRAWFPVPALLTVGGAGTIVSGAHLLAGTPEVVRTVALPMSLGLIYCLVTTARLRQRSGAAELTRTRQSPIG